MQAAFSDAIVCVHRGVCIWETCARLATASLSGRDGGSRMGLLEKACVFATGSILLIMTVACGLVDDSINSEPSANPTPIPTLYATLAHMEASARGRDVVPEKPLLRWIKPPTLSKFRLLSLEVEPFLATLNDPRESGSYYANITVVDITNTDHEIIGTVRPQLPIGAGVQFQPSDKLWIADHYEYTDGVLSAKATANINLSKFDNVEVCIWTGGDEEMNRVLEGV